MPDVPLSSATVQPKFQSPSPVRERSHTQPSVLSYHMLFSRAGGVSGGVIQPLPPQTPSAFNRKPPRQQDPPGHRDPPSARASKNAHESPDHMASRKAAQQQGEEEQRKCAERIERAKDEFKESYVEFQDLTEEANSSSTNLPTQNDPRDNQSTSAGAAANPAKSIEEGADLSANATASSTSPVNLPTEEDSKGNNITSEFNMGGTTKTTEDKEFKCIQAGERAKAVLKDRHEGLNSRDKRREIGQSHGKDAWEKKCNEFRFKVKVDTAVTNNAEQSVSKEHATDEVFQAIRKQGVSNPNYAKDEFFQTTRARQRMNVGHDKNNLSFQAKALKVEKVLKDRKGKRLAAVKKCRGGKEGSSKSAMA